MSSWSFVPQTEAIPKARAAALRALQLDDSLAEAHTSLALIAEIYDYDWQTAEKEYRRAIQLDPQYATAHQWYAECLSFQGRFPEALEESERARQLDPLSLIIATDHAAILYFARQYDRAIEQFRAVLAMEPNFGRAHMVVYVYVEKGMCPEALAETSRWRNADDSPRLGNEGLCVRSVRQTAASGTRVRAMEARERGCAGGGPVRAAPGLYCDGQKRRGPCFNRKIVPRTF